MKKNSLGLYEIVCPKTGKTTYVSELPAKDSKNKSTKIKLTNINPSGQWKE